MNLDIPVNYELKPDSSIDTIINFVKNPQPINIYLSHKKQQINWDEQTDNPDYYRQITRTIIYNIPDEPQQTGKQCVTYYRNGTKDLVTGKTTYTDWAAAPEKTGGEPVTTFPSISLQNLKNYDLEITNADGSKINLVNGAIPEVKVTPDTKSSRLTVTYTKKVPTVDPNQKYNYLINYIDQANDQNVGQQNISGKAGEKVTITLQIPDGYEQTKGEEVPSSVTFGNQDLAPTNVYVIKKGSASPVDKVIQSIVYQDKDRKTVETQNISGTSGDFKTIQWDSQNPGQIVANIPQGWVLSGEQELPTSFNFSENASPIIAIIEHKLDPVAASDHQGDLDFNRTVTRTIIYNYPNQKSQELTQEVSFARNAQYDEVTKSYLYGDWVANSVDAKTGAKISDWPAENFKTIDGYNPQILDENGNEVKDAVQNGQIIIPAENVAADTKNQTWTLNYLAQSGHHYTVNFISQQADDHPNQIIQSQILTGKTGETVQFNLQLPTGWEVVPDTKIPQNGSITFVAKDFDPVSVYVQHKIDTTYGFQNQNDSDFFKTVTRTINISLPAGYTISNNAVMQTREYYRNKLHDEVNGNDSYSAWTSYNTDNSNYFSEYDGLPYDNTLKDYTVTATDNGQNVAVTKKDGKFVLASQSALDNNGTPINRNVSVVYTKKGENPKDQFTYTIDYIDEKDKSNVGSQSIIGQTGQKVDFTLDLPDGYELAKGQTLPTSYTFGNKDASIDIGVQKKTSDNNHPNEDNVTVTINYVDHNNTNDVIGSQKVSAKSGSYELIDWSNSGENNTIKPEIPANWQLATGVKQPDNVNFKDGNVVQVFIEHATQEEKGLDHKGDSNYYREITRTINQILPGQPTNVMKQTVIYYRDGTLDKVTDQVTYGNWQAQGSSQWDKIDLPVSKGYDVTYIDDQGNKLNGIEAVKVNPDTKDAVINVNYSPAQESITINYVDSSDKTRIIGSQVITGKIGDTVHTVLNIPTNWQIVAKQPDYSTYAFGTNTPKSADVLIEHQIQTIYAENNQDNPDLYKTVKQTIVYNYPGDTPKPIERVLVFFRDAHKDLVTGQTSYDQWQAAKDKIGQVMDHFEEINVPDIKGYTAEVKDQDGKTITLVSGPKVGVKYIPEVDNVKYNSKDLAYAVNYIKDGNQAPDHSETASLVIDYVNNDNHSQIVGSQTVSGKVGLAVPVTLNVPEKWMVAEPDKAPTAVMISKDASPVIVYVVHKQTTIKGINDPTNKALNRDAIRTIVLHLPDNATQEITQKVAYVRNQITDEYTGNVSYSNWELADSDEKSFGQVDVTITGYTAQVDGKALAEIDGKQYVAASDFELKNGEPIDQMVTVNYVGNKQTISITYVDQNSVTIGSSQTVSGRTGQTISLPLQVPAGYEVVGIIPSTYTFGAKDNKNLTVTVTKLAANQGRQTINYYDENNNLVGSQYVVGKVGDKVTVTAQIPLNYELAAGQQVPVSVEIQENDKPISIAVNAKLVKVDHQKGIEAGSQIPGENGTYPAGLSKDDLNKTITRTINITNPLTGKTATETQTVTVSRDASYNLVTGKIIYHNLQAELPEYDLPGFNGYKANTSVNAMKVDFDSPNQVVDVTYTKISSNGGGNSGDNNGGNNGNGGNTNNNGGNTNNGNGGQINNGNGTNNGNGGNTNNSGTINNSGATNGTAKPNNNASAPSTNGSKANSSNNDNAAPVYRHKSHHVSSKSKHRSTNHQTNSTYGYSRSRRTSARSVAAHSQDAHWLARHGYVVNVGPHGEVESYQKASDGQGRIVNVAPHADHGFANAGIRAAHSTANAGIRDTNLSNSGLNGALSNSANANNIGSNIVLPGTGTKNDEAAVATAGLAAVSLGLIGLAGVRKKRRN